MIKKYISSNGEELWEAYVCVRNSGSLLRSQKRKKGIKTEALAKKVEMQLMRDAEREITLKGSRKVSWNELLDKYELYLRNDFAETISKHVRIDYIATVRKYTKHWLKRDAETINVFDVREVFFNVKDLVSVDHQIKIKMILTKVFTYGIEASLIKGMQQVPTLGLKFQKAPEKKPEILSLAEIRKLLEAAKEMDHRWYPIWALALLTGMRNGELYALVWDDVDFESKIINLNKSFNKRTRETKCTKSGYWRNIPISSELEVLLKELRVKAEGDRHVLPRIRDWNKGYQARELRAFCDSIGLPSVRFHTLRACFATQLIKQGIPPIQIQKICGWKDLETMQRYVRMAGIEVAGATEKLKILPDRAVMGEVINLFTLKK